MVTVDAGWPPLNTRAWLRLPCCREEHATRIEDVVGDNCVVAAPLDPHIGRLTNEELTAGFFVGWTMSRGAMEIPVSLVAQNEGPLPMWTLQSIGPPTEIQRRRFVRVSVTLETSLYSFSAAAPVHAATVTVSEGGISVAVDKWAMDPGGRIFPVEVGDGLFTGQAQVTRWGPLDSHGFREVGLRFVDVSPAVADRLRRYVFDLQLEQRRIGA